MKVIFRVDASNRMGTGHVMRCLTLAEALRERGVETRFVCRAHPGNLIELLQRQSVPVTVLPEPEKRLGANSDDYAVLLGVPLAEDAEQTTEALGDDRPDWLIIDHYGLDSDWEQRLRPHAVKLMVIDDLANRSHDCDLLLDQNYSDGGEDRYRRLVPETCHLLLGPRYALLRPEYAAYRRILRHRDGQVRRVLVYFGGPDPYNITALALEALSVSEFRHLEVDAVVGASNPHRATLEKHTSVRPLTNLYGPRQHLADLMAQADLSIGAGGGTTWERMCMGLPSFVVSISENQRPACEALSKAGFINYAGDFRQLRASDLCDDIKKFVGNQERSVEIVIQSQLLVDGLGALRIAELIVPTIAEKLRLRPACEHDMGLYFNWINDLEVRQQLIKSDPIPWAQHQKWFTNKLSDHQSHLFVLEAGSLPVGQIRFDREGDEARIDYSLDPLIRRRGWAAHLVAMGAMCLEQSEPVTFRADVKVDNHASRSVFMRLGFKQALSTLKGGGTCHSIAILSDHGSWMNLYTCELFLNWIESGHRVLWTHDISNLRPGDFCFYLSCGQIIPPSVLEQYRHNLVVHESDLPKGKGWSPLTWKILAGRNRIPVTLFEAEQRVDSGVIYAQEWLEFEGHELIGELREAQAKATLNLCKRFIVEYPQILDGAREQVGEESYYPRRFPSDSRLNPELTLIEQFNLLRVVDNDRYPVFFELMGQCYQLKIRKV